jgi:RNA recognition motif-containing protein
MELCSQYGDVQQTHIVVDKTTKFSTGRGYVLFSLPDSAVRYIFIYFLCRITVLIELRKLRYRKWSDYLLMETFI